MKEKVVSCWGYPLALSRCNFINTEWGTIVYSQCGDFLGKYETESAAYEEIKAMIEERAKNGGLIGYAEKI